MINSLILNYFVFYCLHIIEFPSIIYLYMVSKKKVGFLGHVSSEKPKDKQAKN